MSERDLFEAALELPPEERLTFVEGVCAGDPALRERLEALLRKHAQADSFLEQPAVPVLAAPEGPTVREGPGTVVGPYQLREQIGEGGFGIVFLAEQQPPLRRQVALKVVKPGMDSRQVIARFEAERQALALMDHPHIATVLDAGQTASGRPYFAMELVKGLAITDYCDRARFTPRQRLELFIPVCQAVQHAHQKGIIHRDLKPSNVLVTLQDGASVVKVIDFGIAKALGQQLSDKTLYTSFAQMIGTPPYMSPEQAALSNLDIDTRSDIYSLGVLLYELLTGTTPFEKERLKAVGYDEIRRIIREEEPPRPSTRMSTLAQADTTVATGPRSDARQLSHLFRGELDWIVMKCLEKDRNRRYESASALAADVQRYLMDEPVLACPPSGLYRFRKFARRNRGRLAAAGLLAVLLLAAVAGLAVSNVLISREKEQKDQALRQAQANAEEADRQRRLAQANLQLARKAVDDLYKELVGEFSKSGRYDQHLAQKFQQKTLAFYQEFARLQETDPELRLGVARAQFRVAQIHFDFVQNAQAEEAVTQAIARLEELVAERPDDAAPRRELARSCGLLGRVLQRTHRKAAAEPVFRRAIGLLAPGPTDSPAGPLDRYLLAGLYLSLAQVLPPDPTQEAVRNAIQLADRLVADSPDDLAYRALQVHARTRLGRALAGQHCYREAEAAFREVLALLECPPAGLDRQIPAAVRLHLAAVLEATRRHDEAEAEFRKGVELLEQLVHDLPVSGAVDDLFGAYEGLALLVAKIGRTDEATAIRRRALDALGRFVEGLPREEAYEELALNTFSQFTSRLRAPGERLDREPLYRATLAAAERLAAKFPGRPGPQSQLAYWHASLGSILTARGRPAEAADEYRQARDGYRAVLELAPNRAPSLNNLAWLLATCPDPQFRDPGRALDLARKATELAPQYGYLWNTRGVAHYRAGEWEAARAALEKSIAQYANQNQTRHATLESFSTFFLALAHARLGHAAEARRWYDRAVHWMDQYQPDDLELRRFRAEAEELVIPKQ
jgi:serine/threonine protein kinase/tetratricopeptide (TPR) repeat protein